MQVESSTDSGLKIRYNCRGKIINKRFMIKGRRYSELCLKISESFALDKQQMHALFYHDPQKDVITVSSEEDYKVFIRTASPLTLELDTTDDPEKDFMRVAAGQGEGKGVRRNEEQPRAKEEIKTVSQKSYHIRESELQAQFSRKLSKVSRDWQQKYQAKVNEWRQAVVQYEAKISTQSTQIDDLKCQILQTMDEMTEKDKQIKRYKIQLQSFEQRIRAYHRDQIKRSNKVNQQLQQEYNLKSSKLQKEYQQKLQSKEERIKLLQNNCQNKLIQGKIEEEKKRLIQELAQFKDQMREECQRKIGQFFTKFKSNKKRSQVHRNVGCSQQECRFWKGGIVGVMYRCLRCPEFNLCEDCQIVGEYKHDPTHPLIKIYDDQEMKEHDASRWAEWSVNDKKNFLISYLGADQKTTLQYLQKFPLLGREQIVDKILSDGSR